MSKVNALVLCREDYKDEAEFRNVIQNAIMLLLDANYIMTVRYDACDKEMGVVVIDYECADDGLGARYPYWLYPEEAETVAYTQN